jgi:hypothetical protein
MKYWRSFVGSPPQPEAAADRMRPTGRVGGCRAA